MTTPDPITTAREARDLMLRACGPSPMLRVGTTAYDAITAALDYAEKLKAEADPEALVIAHAHGAQMATEKHRAEIARLTSQLDLYKAALAGIHDFANDPKRMEDWDTWRAAIARGDGGSWPRDGFESLLSAIAYDSDPAGGIKDCQEKQALSELHTEEKRLGLE